MCLVSRLKPRVRPLYKHVCDVRYIAVPHSRLFPELWSRRSLIGVGSQPTRTELTHSQSEGLPDRA
ncbi:hypothetical protein PISMIDRAFT_688995 [Pisolithus microcarpus 441]|uniref:Uncharacterized protein n=1 Tax=Pisolithus microcarpus 441 TaxID=765257 RepID=A0A0C9YRZ6_9AGAM|nr:hypothetical protein PISMIDRAFT_688995 [Pisolithus microcarpus 441]